MTVDELIKLWREYKDIHELSNNISFDNFINWLDKREIEQQTEIIRLSKKLDKKPYVEIPNE